MKEQGRQFFRVGGEEVRDRMLIDPEPGRRDQHQLARAMHVERGHLRRQHPAHRLADDVGAVQVQVVHQLMVKQRRVDHVVDFFPAGRFAVAGQMRRDHFEIAPQLLQRRIGLRTDRRRHAETAAARRCRKVKKIFTEKRPAADTLLSLLSTISLITYCRILAAAVSHRWPRLRFALPKLRWLRALGLEGSGCGDQRSSYSVHSPRR